jgi:hypothetical protein
MTTRIYREIGVIYKAEIDFKSIYEAKQWIKANTGLFEPNEVIQITDWKMKESVFCRLQVTIELRDA